MGLTTERRVVKWVERSSTFHRECRFVVTPPTVRTVALAMREFSPVIVRLRCEYLKSKNLSEDLWIEVAAKMCCADRDALAKVLATCCTLWQGAPGELEEMVRSSEPLGTLLVKALLQIFEPSEIVSRMDWEVVDTAIKAIEKPTLVTEEPVLEEEGPSSLDYLIASVAVALNQSPENILDWPYLTVVQLVEKLIPELRGYQTQSGAEKSKLAEYGVF